MLVQHATTMRGEVFLAGLGGLGEGGVEVLADERR